MAKLVLARRTCPETGGTLTFLTTLLRDIDLSADTVRGLTFRSFRPQDRARPEDEVTHPLGMLCSFRAAATTRVVTTPGRNR